MNLLKIAPSKLHLGSCAYIKVFQLCVEHKSWKSSVELFFDIFHVAFTSQDDARDQGLIFLFPWVPWFSFFTNDRGNFLKCFKFVKHVTPEAHLAFCLSSDSVGCVLSCKSGFLKY